VPVVCWLGQVWGQACGTASDSGGGDSFGCRLWHCFRGVPFGCRSDVRLGLGSWGLRVGWGCELRVGFGSDRKEL
jgi:hypothetical protein